MVLQRFSQPLPGVLCVTDRQFYFAGSL